MNDAPASTWAQEHEGKHLTSSGHRRPKSGNAMLPMSIVYLASAFGWRTWKQWRATGDTGLRMGRSGTLPERVAGALFVTSVAATVGAAAERPRDPGLMRATGLALMTSGVLGTLVAQTNLGRSWRIGVDPSEETDLVTTGAFSLVRNPIFTAMATFSLGAGLAQRSPRATIAAATMLAAIELQVRLIEEPYLRNIHGATYDDYVDRTGRFLPTGSPSR